jgi:hypothetical protein
MTYCTEGNINSDNPRGIHWNSLQDGFPHGQGEWKACENFPPCRIHRSIDPLGIVRPHFLQNWGWYGMVHQYRLVDARCVFLFLFPDSWMALGGSGTQLRELRGGMEGAILVCR